jgi:adenylate cyclase
VDVDDTDVWESAGLYDPRDPNAAERLALLEFLTARGATTEQMVDAHSRHALPGLAGELLLQRDKPPVPVSEIAARSDVPVERVLRALLAAGIPAQPDTEAREHLVSFQAAFEAGAALMGDDALLAFTRVLGASAFNIAEAAVALFFAELGPGTPREGPDEVSRARQSEAAVTAFLAVPDVLSELVLEQFELALRRAQSARPWSDPSTALGMADGGAPLDSVIEVAALGFVDLVGSTAWSRTLSLREQNLALTRFESAAWSSAVIAGGRVVKTIGDAVFFFAPDADADAACRIATEICRAATDDPVLPPARGAVGVGPVTPREGDYFGPLVNLLARLVKVGGPGEVVVTQAAASLLSPDRWSLRELSPATLSGVDGAVEAFAVAPVPPGRAQPVG